MHGVMKNRLIESVYSKYKTTNNNKKMKKGEYCLILYYPHPPFFFLQINEWNTLREELEELIAGIILGMKAVCRGIL